jgi:elongation factor G
VEAVAEVDEQVMTEYVGGAGTAVSGEALRAAMRRATLANVAVVVLCGSSLRNKGVQPLLDAVVDYLPSPADMPPVEGHRLSDDAVVRRLPSASEPFLALAFKVVTDPHRGPLVFFRVYSGELRLRQALENTVRHRKEKVQKLLQIHASRTSEIESVGVGGIAAAVGLKFTTTGDTLVLAEDPEPIRLAGLEIPAPVIFRSIEPRSTADQAALEEALRRFEREDPSFSTRTDPDSGQLLICGQGELHLEVIVDRIVREHRVEARVGKPQVAYRETLAAPVSRELTYERDVGGKRQFARIALELRPGERGSGNLFEDALSPPAPGHKPLPKESLAAIREGVGDAQTRGALLGYPVVDVQVRLVAAQAAENDPVSEAAFRAAATMATMEALEGAAGASGGAAARLLEPAMAVEVVVPDEFTGNVVSDLSGRRGRIQAMDPVGSPGSASRGATAQVIRAEVPLAEMVGYATSLRSATQGRATYTMRFSHYAEVPADLQASIVARHRGD